MLGFDLENSPLGYFREIFWTTIEFGGVGWAKLGCPANILSFQGYHVMHLLRVNAGIAHPIPPNSIHKLLDNYGGEAECLGESLQELFR